MIIENKLINSLIKITYHKINTFIAHSTYSQSFLSFFTNLYTSKFFIKSHEHNRGPIITPRPTAAPKQPLKKKKKTCAPPRQPPYCYNRQTTLHYLPIPPTVCNHPKESSPPPTRPPKTWSKRRSNKPVDTQAAKGTQTFVANDHRNWNSRGPENRHRRPPPGGFGIPA